MNDSSVYDYSSYFTIEPDEEVNITSLSSSTSIEPGESYTIRWSDNFSDNVKLELYKGSSWQQTIARSTSSDGGYSWRAPTSLSSGTNYRIKILNVNDSSVYDYSSYFTIEPDEEVNITSTSSTSNDGSYSWTTPTSLSSGTNYNIKIRSVNDSSVYDYSNSFTVQSTWLPRVAKDLKNYTGREEYSGYVGSDAYYKFYVDSPGYLQFGLRGMSADAEEAVNAVQSDTVVVASSPGNPGHIAIVRPDSEINNIVVAQAGWETGEKLSIGKAFGTQKTKLKYFKYVG